MDTEKREHEPNPIRGCGTKAEDACYGESPPPNPNGLLDPWSWLFGDGFSDLLVLTVPPRKMIVCNPAATIYLRELERDSVPTFNSRAKAEGYARMLQRTKNTGIADHVGQEAYSVISFYKETIVHGISRRMSRQTARELSTYMWNYGPLPILFTHNRIPVFDDRQHLGEAIKVIDPCLEYGNLLAEDEKVTYIPTWEEEDWSQFTFGKPYGSHGNIHHIIMYMLLVVEDLDRNWRVHSNRPGYQDARDFFKDIRFVEQAFGMTWMDHITMTADVNGEWDDEVQEMEHKFGKNIIKLIDLSELEESA